MKFLYEIKKKADSGKEGYIAPSFDDVLIKYKNMTNNEFFYNFWNMTMCFAAHRHGPSLIQFLSDIQILAPMSDKIYSFVRDNDPKYYMNDPQNSLYYIYCLMRSTTGTNESFHQVKGIFLN